MHSHSLFSILILLLLLVEAPGAYAASRCEHSETSLTHVRLTAGSTKELSLEPGQALSLTLENLTAGSWLLSVDQTFADVAVLLKKHREKEALCFDTPGARRTTEHIVIDVPGHSHIDAVLVPISNLSHRQTASISLSKLSAMEALEDDAVKRANAKIDIYRALTGAALYNASTSASSSDLIVNDLGRAIQEADRFSLEALELVVRHVQSRIHIDDGQTNRAINVLLPGIDEVSPDHSERYSASLMGLLGYAYVLNDEFDKARDIYSRLLPIDQKRATPYFYLQTRGNICWLSLEAKSPATASECYKQLEPELLASNEPGLHATALNNQVGIAFNQGDPNLALSFMEQLLPLRQRLGKSSGLSSAHNNAGFLYRRVNEIQKAVEHYRQAIIYRRLAKDQRGLAGTLNNLGYLYQIMGDYQRSQEVLGESLRIHRKIEHSSGRARTLSNLAEVSRLRGEYSQAIEYLEEALGIWQEKGDERGVCRVATKHSASLRETGSFKAAADVLASFDNTCSTTKDVWTRAGFLLESANSHQEHGRYARAWSNAQRSLDLNMKLNDAIGSASARQTLSTIALRLDATGAAFVLAQHAIGNLESVRASISSSDTLVHYTAIQQGAYEHLARMLLHGDDTNYTSAVHALGLLEKNRARTLMESIHRDASSEITERKGAKEQQFRATRRKLANLSYRLRRQSNSDTVSFKELRIEHELARAELEKLDVERRRLSSTAENRELDLSELQKLLASNELVLFYWLSAESSYVWHITRQSIKAHRLPDEKKIASLAERFIDAVRNGSTTDSDHISLGKPLAELLLSGTDLSIHNRLYVVTDNVLSQIPFVALPVDFANSKTDNYLIDHAKVSYLPALRFLHEARSSSRAIEQPKRAIVFSDPVYSVEDERLSKLATGFVGRKALSKTSSAGVNWQRLPSSALEADAIASAFGHANVKTFSGLAATRSALVAQRFEPHDLLHLASHATVNVENTKANSIVLSLVNEQGAQNGYVDKLDILNIQPAPSIVVLSACDTASGEIVSGEGVDSLSRSMLSAGTLSVIASLWPAGDRATLYLMEDFYASLINDKASPAEALRKAQLELRGSERIFRHPRYWANFVVNGH